MANRYGPTWHPSLWQKKWRDNWWWTFIVNRIVVSEPTVWPSGFNLPHQMWSMLNQFQTSQGQHAANWHEWWTESLDKCLHSQRNHVDLRVGYSWASFSCAGVFSKLCCLLHSVSVALRYGTGYQTVWEIRPLAETPSSVHWRRFYFQLTWYITR